MNTKTIRALTNPLNLHFRFLSRNWRQEMDLEADSTLTFDGDEFVCETRSFPDGTERFIRLAGGLAFQRNKPREQWTCIGGSEFGRKVDEIEVNMEVADESDGALFGCMFLNVIGFDVVYLKF